MLLKARRDTWSYFDIFELVMDGDSDRLAIFQTRNHSFKPWLRLLNSATGAEFESYLALVI